MSIYQRLEGPLSTRGRFLLTTLGTGGDVLPYIAIGSHLVARGHEVVILAHEHFRSEAIARGLEFDAIGSEDAYDTYIRTPDLWDRRKCLQVSFDALIRPHMEEGFRLIEKHYVPGRTVLVCSSFVFFGRVAQEVLGVPLVSVTLQPCSLFRDDMPPRTTGERIFGLVAGRAGRRFYRRRHYRELDSMLGWVNDFRRGFGLQAARDVVSDWRYSRQGMLGLWPDLFFDGPTTCPVQFAQPGFVFNDGSGLTSNGRSEDWAGIEESGGDRSPFVFTLGTGMVQGAEFFRIAAETCRVMGRSGILVTGDEAQIPATLPDGVRHLAWAPFSELLPRAGVFVHHGGIGSTARAMVEGTPQVLIPLAYDQFDNARLADRLGVGGSIPFAKLNVSGLRDELERVDGPAVRDRCREWSTRLRGDESGEKICRYLEARMGQDRGTV
jgi:UDP:flavonoid glycosyltransferase YjiC (YdhE family)